MRASITIIVQIKIEWFKFFQDVEQKNNIRLYGGIFIKAFLTWYVPMMCIYKISFNYINF